MTNAKHHNDKPTHNAGFPPAALQAHQKANGGDAKTVVINGSKLTQCFIAGAWVVVQVGVV